MTVRFLLLLVTFLLVQCQATVNPGELLLNQIQVIGSHNSYKVAIDEVAMAQIARDNPAAARSLDYAHVPIAEQLTLGLRNLELDVFHDPAGGLYASPVGAALPGATPFDPDGEMQKPGFKVLHAQDIDFRSHCALLVGCLEQIVAWSLANDGHLPVFVLINAKDGAIDLPGFTVPLRFDEMAWRDLDAEIRLGLKDRLLTPDDVRGTFATLRQAVLAGWPPLAQVRGKVIVVLDDSAAKKASYLSGHPSAAGRAMFVDVPADSPAAAIMVMNNPLGQREEIEALVRQGFIVRTRADADTREARVGDLARLQAALASGAQIISTDYYLPEPRFGHGFHVTLPGGDRVRCNPVLTRAPCKVRP
ncbi:MAG: phosphatidylinositol-specific phospholipase C1-like protein [Pseudomonadota bacterium]